MVLWCQQVYVAVAHREHLEGACKLGLACTPEAWGAWGAWEAWEHGGMGGMGGMADTGNTKGIKGSRCRVGGTDFMTNHGSLPT